ncbi:MAG: FAD-binding oxidoreductase [Rufibacter sp.]
MSRLNQTRIDSLVKVHPDSAVALHQLISLLTYAKANKKPVSIAGARHSMGGHTIAPDGIYINMLPFKHLSLDTTTHVLRVGAGALWAEVIPYLNKYGRSVSIMQSDNAFSVGGSISVNCHGWQHNKPPIASSVLSFDLLLANGKVITCSRKENPELFSLALGGYGLFGIILYVELQTVPNEMYSYHRVIMPSEKYLAYYTQHVDRNKLVKMVFGRLNVTEENFLETAMLHYFEYQAPAPRGSSLQSPEFTTLKKSIFLGSKNEAYGKKLRWNSEQVYSRLQIGSVHARNQIMNGNPADYLNQSSSQTDILHEYFIPRENFHLFVEKLQEIVPTHQQDLLNVTVRNVYQDKDTYLHYAPSEMFAFVMFFNQTLSPAAEKDMVALTQELIYAATQLGGKYYLPYRLHATKEQFHQAYPMAQSFFKKKLQYDSAEIFQNKFYQTYKPAPSALVSR